MRLPGDARHRSYPRVHNFGKAVPGKIDTTTGAGLTAFAARAKGHRTFLKAPNAPTQAAVSEGISPRRRESPRQTTLSIM
jgi:hypothetical protein